MKPFLKWVGGKTTLLSDLQSHFPKKIRNYYEPFIGGGSVFLMLMNSEDIVVKRFYLNDKNAHLINVYKCIQNNIEELNTKLKALHNTYHKAEMIEQPKRHAHVFNEKWTINDIVKKGKSYVYYHYRNVFNEHKSGSVEEAALFIFLNKTCFRGLFREGKNGFNVPFGHYKNPKIFIDLMPYHKLFTKHNITFSAFDYKIFLKKRKITKKDFVYMDPPYIPVNKTSFVDYNKQGFNHDELIELCNTMKNVSFVQSNSYCDKTKNGYKAFQQHHVVTKRRINSKNPGSKIKEIMIVNTS